MLAQMPPNSLALSEWKGRDPAVKSRRELYGEGKIEVYERNFQGRSVKGPCVVEEETTTVMVNNGWTANLDKRNVMKLERD